MELRQHLHTRDFLPDDVSELSSVAAVDVDVAAGAGGAIVLVVVVVSSGCRQQVEDDSDVVAPVAAVTFGASGDGAADTGLVDSFVLLPWVVFRIFSSQSPVSGACRTDAIAQRGHSPALNGCSSLL